MSADRQRILQLLQERGEQGVTTYELRTGGYSGNPAQRVAELREDGHTIDAEATHRLDPHGKKRPMTIYTLRGGEAPNDGQASGVLRKPASVEECSRTGGAVESMPGTGGRGLGNKHPAASCGTDYPEGDAATPSGVSSAGATPMAPVDPPRLFDVQGASYYEREAA